MTPAELDRQYNARAAVPEHPEILARWAARSAQARQERHCETDYYYGASPAETLDFFPARKPGAPLLVFIHGGWWRSLDKQDFSFIAPAFVDAGAAVALINYSLAPKAHLEDIVPSRCAPAPGAGATPPASASIPNASTLPAIPPAAIWRR